MPSRRTSSLALVAAAVVLLAGCSGGGGPFGRDQDDDRETIPEPLPEGQLMVEHLALLEEFSTASPEEQQSMLQSARRSAADAPASDSRLRYALLLAYPTGEGHDPDPARVELEALLASAVPLSPSERTLARLLLEEADARSALLHANEDLAAQLSRSEKGRDQAATRRIQSQAAEIERLKAALEQAEAKLKAVAELEKSLTEKQTAPKGPPP